MAVSVTPDSDAQKVLDTWVQKFKQATDFDSWGQLVEAADEYSCLSRAMKLTMDGSTGAFDRQQMKVIRNIEFCIDARAKFLKSMQATSSPEMLLADVNLLSTVLKNLLDPETPAIPQELNKRIEAIKGRREKVANYTTSPSPETAAGSSPEGNSPQKLNSLLPRLKAGKNQTLVTVSIDKIGLKKARDIIDPFIVVSCKDGDGVDICPVQNTTNASSRDDAYLYFDVEVELQTPIEKMPKRSAVYFELKHYKPKKRMTSLKCYSFMDMDELKSGSCVIELYKKPVGYTKRNKLPLLTSKPLYLHLRLALHTE